MGDKNPEKIDLSGLVILVGSYGSGKTEVAVNLALDQRSAGKEVQIADLDLVNPYFRTREVGDLLARAGVQIVLPPKAWRHADLPLLTPRIGGMIRAPRELAILDVGGNNVGARVLAALADHIDGKSVQMLQVVNPYRPFTETIAGCRRIRRQIEAACGLKVTGLVGNPNLMDETTWEAIAYGHRFLLELSAAEGLPLMFMALDQGYTDRYRAQWGGRESGCPVLALRRQLVPPWRKPASLGPLFRNLG